MPPNWTLKQLLALTFIKGIKYSGIRDIVERYPSLEDFAAARESSGQGSIDGIIFGGSLSSYYKLADEQIQMCEESASRIVTIWDDDYPPLLRYILYPPPMLFIKGDFKPLDRKLIAIVGTRKCTTYGKLCAERFAAEFAANGIVVVSGLAYGIDTTSHMAVVKAGGTTYAVIACGQDRISPQSSQKNADKIIEAGGAIVSEYRFGVPARPGYFPQRNRIISGMSDACLVVESGSRGGSLITAKFAFDQERDVFAIPGNISSQKSEGTNTLIKTNIAMPALTPGGVLEDLGIDFEKLDFSEMKIKFDSSEEEMLYNKLSFEPVHIDTLADNTKLDISVILVRLLDLEFKGLARQLPGKYYIKAS